MVKSDMPRRLPSGCVEDRDRHGNLRVYYRAKGVKKVRLHGTPWTPDFMAAYENAKGTVPKPAKNVIGVGTWRWLCVKYFAECADYRRLDPRTRHVRRLILESTFEERIAPGSAKFFRDMPLSKMTADAVEVLRDRKLEYPEAANSRVKAIRQVFKFGVRKKFSPFNPARDVPYIRTGSTGYHTWTVDEVRQFETRHPIGSKARLALALLVFTGQRRSDIVRFGKQHVAAGKLTFTQ
jgi:integrase